MNLYHLVIGICWLALIAAWGILAMVFGGGGRSNNSPMALGVRLLIIFVIFLGFLFAGHFQMFPSGVLVPDVAIAGAVLCVVGLVFATWARVVLGSNWGMPMTLHEAPELVTGGPYRYVRHPIYTGLIAMWIGTVLVYPITLPVSAGVIIYSVFSALREERDMEQRFPETYPEYRRRSKMLLPFLF